MQINLLSLALSLLHAVHSELNDTDTLGDAGKAALSTAIQLIEQAREGDAQ